MIPRSGGGLDPQDPLGPLDPLMSLGSLSSLASLSSLGSLAPLEPGLLGRLVGGQPGPRVHGLTIPYTLPSRWVHS